MSYGEREAARIADDGVHPGIELVSLASTQFQEVKSHEPIGPRAQRLEARTVLP